ncbi:MULTISPECIES: hypothetical protein [unclassified Anaeromyxobacter]|uniref:hypothetical protein n=1 Tax=unclassified Anaeromyxobacter TaxID=2620896 RepID=UPI001F59D750|nr:MULTISPECIES: hypothetical protein [unclassified Anaeromyxobacter]
MRRVIWAMGAALLLVACGQEVAQEQGVGLDQQSEALTVEPAGIATNPHCAKVGHIYWCYDPDYSTASTVGCTDMCASIGQRLMRNDSKWFNAQNSLAECNAIATALGLTTDVANSYSSYAYACAEYLPTLGARMLQCSSDSTCPDSVKTAHDGGQGLVCPCH